MLLCNVCNYLIDMSIALFSMEQHIPVSYQTVHDSLRYRMKPAGSSGLALTPITHSGALHAHGMFSEIDGIAYKLP